MELQIGTKAPDFRLKDQNGIEHSLKDYAGKKLALYFYPKDDTPGCTKEACGIRDNWTAFQKAGLKVFGVSADAGASHQKFRAKYDLPHTLLTADIPTLEKLGVWKEKSMYGKTFMGIKRMTFLIDENGKIRAIIEKPDTANHAREIMEGFE